MAREFVTLRADHIDKPELQAFGRRWNVVDFLGRIMAQDIGKRVYLVGDILQLENEEQRDKRLSFSGFAADKKG